MSDPRFGDVSATSSIWRNLGRRLDVLDAGIGSASGGGMEAAAPCCSLSSELSLPCCSLNSILPVASSSLQIH